MRKAIAVASLAATAILAGGGVAGAQSVTRTPAQVAASDFAAWQQHETTPDMMRLVHDAYRLPGYGHAGTASDILQLAADVAGGAKAKYISEDIEYLRDDFAGAN